MQSKNSAKPIKRGRGRPRKNQIQTNNKSNKSNIGTGTGTGTGTDGGIVLTTTNQKEVDDEIILHLPLSLKDIKKDISLKKSNDQENIQDTNIFTINDIHSDSNGSCEINDAYIYDLKEKIKEQEKSIKNLLKELDEYKSLVSGNEDYGENDLNQVNGTNNKKVTKMDIKLIDCKTGNPVIVEKTDIACWWCSYNFDNPPCFLPENYVNNTFYVFGCFCTFNCAITYNLNINDSSVWNRYSLLKKLYSLIYKTECNISLAPPREVFDKFGGILKYENYRKTCNKNMKEYRFIMPPMTSIIPLIEEGCTDNTKVNISLADINRRTSLRRTKPLPNTKNALFETFGIK